MAAGLAGGLAGALAMAVASRYLSKLAGSAPHGGPQDATVEAASAASQALMHRDLTLHEKQIAPTVVHFGFGGTMGALYGAAAALAPDARRGAGLPFGTAVWLGAHVYAVPKLGLSQSPMDRPLAEEAIEFAAHLVYGAVTELVYSLCGPNSASTRS